MNSFPGTACHRKGSSEGGMGGFLGAQLCQGWWQDDFIAQPQLRAVKRALLN